MSSKTSTHKNVILTIPVIFETIFKFNICFEFLYKSFLRFTFSPTNDIEKLNKNELKVIHVAIGKYEKKQYVPKVYLRDSFIAKVGSLVMALVENEDGVPKPGRKETYTMRVEKIEKKLLLQYFKDEKLILKHFYEGNDIDIKYIIIESTQFHLEKKMPSELMLFVDKEADNNDCDYISIHKGDVKDDIERKILKVKVVYDKTKEIKPNLKQKSIYEYTKIIILTPEFDLKKDDLLNGLINVFCNFPNVTKNNIIVLNGQECTFVNFLKELDYENNNFLNNMNSSIIVYFIGNPLVKDGDIGLKFYGDGIVKCTFEYLFYVMDNFNSPNKLIIMDSIIKIDQKKLDLKLNECEKESNEKKSFNIIISNSDNHKFTKFFTSLFDNNIECDVEEKMSSFYLCEKYMDESDKPYQNFTFNDSKYTGDFYFDLNNVKKMTKKNQPEKDLFKDVFNDLDLNNLDIGGLDLKELEQDKNNFEKDQ
jgi:hypothetical protein